MFANETFKPLLSVTQLFTSALKKNFSENFRKKPKKSIHNKAHFRQILKKWFKFFIKFCTPHQTLF